MAILLLFAAFLLLLVIEVTSLFMRRLPRKVWHGIHLTSYLVFWLVAVHGATAGTDAGNRAYTWGSILAIAVVLFLTIYRVTVDRRASRAVARRRTPTDDTTAAPIAASG